MRARSESFMIDNFLERHETPGFWGPYVRFSYNWKALHKAMLDFLSELGKERVITVIRTRDEGYEVLYWE